VGTRYERPAVVLVALLVAVLVDVGPDHVLEEAETAAVSETAKIERGLTAVDLTRRERVRLDYRRLDPGHPVAN
jgi:hypothetical protein